MFLVFLIVLVAVPVIELLVTIQVAGAIGWGDTLGLMLLVSVLGFFLLKWAGLGAAAPLAGPTSTPVASPATPWSTAC